MLLPSGWSVAQANRTQLYQRKLQLAHRAFVDQLTAAGVDITESATSLPVTGVVDEDEPVRRLPTEI